MAGDRFAVWSATRGYLGAVERHSGVADKNQARWALDRIERWGR